MIVVDSLLVGGLRFVLDALAAAAEREEGDADALRERLLEAQMRFELGEISADELGAIEAEVMAALRRQRSGPAAGGAISFGADGAGVELEVDAGEEDRQG